MNTFWVQIDFISCILCICALYHMYMWTPIIFRVKNIFEANVFKWVIKTNFINISPFAFLIINIKILANFQKEWCIFDRKKVVWRKTKIVHSWSLNAVNMQKHFLFVSSFEDVKFGINGKHSKFFFDNPNYYASIVIFQRYKNVVLRSVHSLGWIFLLWFYPIQNVFSSKCPQSNQTLINWTFKFDLPSCKSHLELFTHSHINSTVYLVS
jgi:hypothetical protein